MEHFPNEDEEGTHPADSDKGHDCKRLPPEAALPAT